MHKGKTGKHFATHGIPDTFCSYRKKVLEFRFLFTIELHFIITECHSFHACFCLREIALFK